MKAGMVAMWIQKTYGIPYVLSEHWTDYLSAARPNFDDLPPVQKNIISRIFKDACWVTVVSKTLGEAVADRFSVVYSVIPNVVDTSIFFPASVKPGSKTTFIHVSSLSYQKNIPCIIRATEIVKSEGYDFSLVIVGPASRELNDILLRSDLLAYVVLKEEMPQVLLAELVQQSDALILYSRYETFGCVVIEANACGIPAILSNLPVFKEYSLENKTAIFAGEDDPAELANAMIRILKNRNLFDPQKIWLHTVTNFSYPVVARKFDELYERIAN